MVGFHHPSVREAVDQSRRAERCAFDRGLPPVAVTLSQDEPERLAVRAYPKVVRVGRRAGDPYVGAGSAQRAAPAGDGATGSPARFDVSTIRSTSNPDVGAAVSSSCEPASRDNAGSQALIRAHATRSRSLRGSAPRRSVRRCVRDRRDTRCPPLPDRPGPERRARPRRSRSGGRRVGSDRCSARPCRIRRDSRSRSRGRNAGRRFGGCHRHGCPVLLES